MFLLRLAIVLFVIALFFPSTPKEKQEVYRSLSSAAEQMQTFCLRNPDLCDDVGTFVTAVANRVHIGAQIVYETVTGTQEGGWAWDEDRPYPARMDRRSPRDDRYDRQRSEHSRNTLRRGDLSPEWRGPGA